MEQPKVAVVGAGPAGIYAADMISKARPDATVDVLERLPAPFGLVRYGVAPDHPRIALITQALAAVLERGGMAFYGNVNVGTDVSLAQVREYYDVVVVATGADRERQLRVPGAEKAGVYGAADFVSWYDGHPDVPRQWPLTAQSVAVIGAGNVAMDVARVLAKDPDALATTDIPQNVEDGLRGAATRDVHVFARRGPAQVKFSVNELRELARTPGVDISVVPEDFQYDAASQARVDSVRQAHQVADLLTSWVFADEHTAPRHIHIHMLQRPVEILGEDRVTGIRMERTRLTGDDQVEGIGEYIDYPVQAVYNAIGYASEPLPPLPFDAEAYVIPNSAGRIAGAPGVYVTGWAKRGPVGLIGSTKSDAKETVACLLEDWDQGRILPAPRRAESFPDALARRGMRLTTWDGWHRIDAYEQALGRKHGRTRTKVVGREELTAIASGEEALSAPTGVETSEPHGSGQTEPPASPPIASRETPMKRDAKGCGENASAHNIAAERN